MVEHTDLNLMIATVLSCKKVSGARTLHEIIVDCGTGGQRRIASSIPGQGYSKELVGRQILIQEGVPETTIMGIKSNARLLCCRSDGGKPGTASGRPIMVSPEEPVPTGSSVW